MDYDNNATRNPYPFETLLRAKPINGNKHLHTHKKNFRYGRYKASQQRNTSEAQARSQRRISTPSLLSTTCSQCFDQATSKTLSRLIDLVGLLVDLQYRYCKSDLQLPVDLAGTSTGTVLVLVPVLVWPTIHRSSTVM